MTTQTDVLHLTRTALLAERARVRTWRAAFFALLAVAVLAVAGYAAVQANGEAQQSEDRIRAMTCEGLHGFGTDAYLACITD